MHVNLTTIDEAGLPVRHVVEGGLGEPKIFPRIVLPLEKARAYEKNKMGKIIGSADDIDK